MGRSDGLARHDDRVRSAELADYRRFLVAAVMRRMAAATSRATHLCDLALRKAGNARSSALSASLPIAARRCSQVVARASSSIASATGSSGSGGGAGLAFVAAGSATCDCVGVGRPLLLLLLFPL